MNELEQALIRAIVANPLASQQELASALGLSRESVAGYISRLTRRGAILGKGYILPQPQSIVVIGGANVDLAGCAAQGFQAGDSNPGSVQQSAGGVGRNIAENLARLGNETALISLIGNDSRGRFLLEQAATAGIITHDVIQHPTQATSTYLALFTGQGDLVGAVADMSILEHLTPELLATKLPRLHSAGQIIVDANLSDSCLQWLARQSFTAPVSADAVSVSKAPRLLPLLPKLNVLKVNIAEARAILGKTDTDSLTVDALLAQLHDQGVKHVLLSQGSAGALLSTESGQVQRPVPNCAIVSDSGAGDALLAGYLHARLQYENTTEQLDFAMACAAVTLETHQAVFSGLTESYIHERIADSIHTTASAPA